jgi:hypothetical protein
MHFCELAGFDPAILQKPDENFPACWTIVKWLDLTCSVNRIKVHSGATLNLNFLCVTRSLSPIGPARYHRRSRQGTLILLAGTKTTALANSFFEYPGILGRTRSSQSYGRAAGELFSVLEIRNLAKAGGESRLYFRDDMRKLADIRFEIGASNHQARQILQSADAG